jgi:hypothetical protein
MKSGVSVVVDRSKNLEAALKALAGQEVLVGIPADKAQRQAAPEDGENAALTNAQLGYIHEHGSPARNIPARPFLATGIKDARDAIVDQLRAAGKTALDGNISGVDTALNKAGLIGQNSVRNHFVDNDWPALAESTLNKVIGQVMGGDGKVLKKGKTRAQTGAINPLILSGQLRKAITYVVRKRKG